MAGMNAGLAAYIASKKKGAGPSPLAQAAQAKLAVDSKGMKTPPGKRFAPKKVVDTDKDGH